MDSVKPRIMELNITAMTIPRENFSIATPNAVPEAGGCSASEPP